MAEAGRLRVHSATTTCCIASLNRPGLVLTSSEDGCVCWFDMRCKDVLFVMNVGDEPISSLCFKQGNEDIVYVSSGTEVKCFDVHQAISWKPLESYSYNKEEINQIICDPKSSFLAAADDTGDVKIIDIQQHCLFKTLRSGHESYQICSTVQFFPWRPWEVIKGGIDSKPIIWDFSKGRPNKSIDFNVESRDNGEQYFNPTFVHSIVVPEVDMLDKIHKICTVGRGDGIVSIIDIESKLADRKSRNSSKSHKGGRLKSKGSVYSPSTEFQEQNVNNYLNLDHTLGGHTAAVSCV